jgi:sugar-specific transcriptional regulator TrmB
MSGYEAKAYLALVGSAGPLNGYVVAKRSGVPRSAIYETLGKLVARGAAFEAPTEGEVTVYVALPVYTLLRRLRDAFDHSLESLTQLLPLVVETPGSPLAHHLEGRSAVLARASDLIGGAELELYVSAWASELDALKEPLRRAEDHGVEISIVRFGEGEVSAGHTCDHLFAKSDVVLERVGCRLLVVAQDRRSVLIGGAVGTSMWGLYSEDPAVVLVAVEFIRHDIGFQILVGRLGLDEAEHVFSEDPNFVRLARGRGAPGLERRLAAEAQLNHRG